MEINLVKKVSRYRERLKFCESSEYKRFLKEKKQKIIYLSEIDHSNLGDHAILYAQHLLIDKNFNEIPKFSFTRKECLFGLDLIQKGVRNEDILLIPGGGWIGTLWPVSGELFLSFLETFRDNKIIIFPQTIYFDNSEYGNSQKKRFYDAVDNCIDITIYVREAESYQFLKEKMPKENQSIKYGLIPDMVLSLQPKIQAPTKEHILFVMRSDLEKVSDDNLIEAIKANLQRRGYAIRYSDTHSLHPVSPEQREAALFEKWKEFAEAKLVVTDRLHGMLFAAINSTPCLALDNLSGKVKGVYDEWLADNPQIICLANRSADKGQLISVIEQLLNSGEYYFKEDIYKQYFDNTISDIME